VSIARKTPRIHLYCARQRHLETDFSFGSIAASRSKSRERKRQAAGERKTGGAPARPDYRLAPPGFVHQERRPRDQKSSLTPAVDVYPPRAKGHKKHWEPTNDHVH
jgi:hypothetical protein